MATIAEQLTQLESDRQDLVSNLETKGITGLTGNETFTELVPYVLQIGGGGGGGNLPDIYQEVEYIQSSGTQRIDTGITPLDNNYGFRAKFCLTELQGDWNIMNMGASNVDEYRFGIGGCTPTPGQSYIPPLVNYRWQVSYIRAMDGYNTFVYNVTDQMTLNYDYEIEYNYNHSRSFIVNDYTMNTNILEGNYNGYNNTWNIFCMAYNSGNYARFMKGKLYFMKIYLGETLVRDYVPCYRKSDGTIGLYDLVNGTFNTNAGSGTFTKGSDV